MNKNANRFFILVCALFISVLYRADGFSAEDSNTTAVIGVVPFSPLGIEKDNAEDIAKSIGSRLNIEAVVVELDDIMEAMDDADCDDEDKWDDKECVHEAGKRLNADYLIAGSIGKVGESIFTEVYIFDIPGNQVIWNNEYKRKCTIEEFIRLSIQEIAEDITANLPKSLKKSIASKRVQTETDAQAPAVSKIHPPDNGIAKGISIGVKGLFALGSVENSQYLNRAQSPAGFMVFSLFPLTPNTQLRVRAGIPLWHINGKAITEESGEYFSEVTVDKKNPDPYFSVEHAWGWEKIGFSFGMSYLYLNKYNRDVKEYDDFTMDTTYCHFEYDKNHFFNVVCSFRGGKTRGGFFGMIAFPLAITLEKGRTDYLLEYSLFGVFGAKNTKVGLGHMGMIKRREADTVTINGNDYYYGDPDSREAYMLFPCIKAAQLIGSHVVLNLTFELGGTIIPRFGNMEKWRPSIGADVLFSFGKLDGPNIMDGTF